MHEAHILLGHKDLRLSKVKRHTLAVNSYEASLNSKGKIKEEG